MLLTPTRQSFWMDTPPQGYNNYTLQACLFVRQDDGRVKEKDEYMHPLSSGWIGNKHMNMPKQRLYHTNKRRALHNHNYAWICHISLICHLPARWTMLNVGYPAPTRLCRTKCIVGRWYHTLHKKTLLKRDVHTWATICKAQSEKTKKKKKQLYIYIYIKICVFAPPEFLFNIYIYIYIILYIHILYLCVYIYT